MADDNHPASDNDVADNASAGHRADDTGAADVPAVMPETGEPVDGDSAKPAPQTLKDGANKVLGEAGDKVRGYAEQGKARAGSALDELSMMINGAADQVDEKLGGQYGQYARSAADAISGFSESLKAKQVDDLIDDARGFVKKSPAVAIGAAAAIGFVLSRVIKSGLDASRTDAHRDRT